MTAGFIFVTAAGQRTKKVTLDIGSILRLATLHFRLQAPGQSVRQEGSMNQTERATRGQLSQSEAVATRAVRAAPERLQSLFREQV